MRKYSLILNIFLTLILVLMWGCILFFTLFLYLASDIFTLFGKGILMYVFLALYVLSFILPVVFRKRINRYMSMPMSFIVCAILSFVVALLMLIGAKEYISEFSVSKWKNNERLRFYMIEELEDEYTIVGRTQKEIVSLLGEPTYVYHNHNTYEYYVGDSLIDPFGYVIEFENGSAKNTRLIEY